MEILERILSNREERSTLIRQFQEKVWNEGGYSNDLDFYEPKKAWRKESKSYYGENRLEEEIKATLSKLEELSTNPS